MIGGNGINLSNAGIQNTCSGQDVVKAALPNTQKQTQETAKLRRQRNMAQMKEHIKTPIKN